MEAEDRMKGEERKGDMLKEKRGELVQGRR